MVEPLSTAAVAALVVKYAIPAIKALGEKVFDEASDQVADDTVGFGARMLRRLLPKRADGEPSASVAAIREEDVRAGVTALAKRPDDPTVEVVFEADIAKLLASDEARLAAISELLRSAPQSTVTQGDRSIYVGGDSSGVNITGDGNSVTNTQR